MRRPLLPGLAVLILFGLVPVPAAAEENDGRSGEVKDFEGIEDFGEFDIEELVNVVFTAAKHEQDIAESPSAITVITREQIENTYCTDVVCLLRQVPEVDARRLAPMFSAVGARALTDVMGDRTLVLVDGREINIELFGFALWQALPVHLEDIERIEVIRGPGSALYGANAHSMVVSIITRKAIDRTAELFLGSGERGRTSLHLRLGQEFGRLRLLLSGGLDTAGNWLLNFDREREVGRLRLHAEYQTDSSTSTLQAGIQSVDGGIYSPFGVGAVDDGYMTHAVAVHKREFLSAQASYTVCAGNFPLDFAMYYQGIKLGDLPQKIPFVNQTLDAEMQFNWSPWEGNLLIAGGNYRFITASSEETEPSELVQHRVGVFIHDEQRLFDRLILTGGIRFDFNTITPSTVSPRVAAVWRIAGTQHLRLAFGRAFRKPSFFNSSVHLKGVRPEPAFPELRQFFLDNIGNEDLDNESITTLEAGYHGRFLDDGLTVETDVFYNRYRDTINLQVEVVTDNFGVPDFNRSVAKHSNEGREVDSIGGSVSLTYQVKETLRLNANYTCRYSWYISGGSGSEFDRAEEGDRVAWEPAHLLNLTYHHFLGRGWRLGMGMHAASSFRAALVESGVFGDVHRPEMPSTWYLSGFAAWRLDMGSGWMELGVRALNLLNMPFRDLPGFMRPQEGQLGGAELVRRLYFFLRGAV